MSPASLSIKRPFFISCLVILMVVLGLMSLKSLPIDLFPDVSFPTIMIETTYAGAGPSEMETEVSKVIEDELTSISGVHKISSTNREGYSQVSAEFELKQDIKYAEQQVRAKVDNVRRNLPQDIDQPTIRSISPSDAPIMELALIADIPDGDLFDLADDKIRPLIEQVNQVGRVDILGGRKRQVEVMVDLDKARFYQLPASAVTNALKGAGKNVPGGKVDQGASEKSFRTMAEFNTIDAIKYYVVRMTGSERPIVVGDLAKVVDSLEDETSRTWFDGKRALSFQIYRQTGANTVQVAIDVKKRVELLNKRFADLKGHPQISVVNDRSRIIQNNVDDVYESIIIGIVLTIVVVYFFLGSFRSTLITGLALPNSLLGAFILMSWMGFSINIMSLLALSLVVGLLIDDAIVVRENIYRKIEEGMGAMEAALKGTNEVTLAVVATTLTVLAVFGPIGNLQGIIGQFFKQFGLTICFAMAISLFDALTIAPMLSAYFAGNPHGPKSKNAVAVLNARMLGAFDRFQTRVGDLYERVLKLTLHHPGKTLMAGLAIFVCSCVLLKWVPVTFLPPQDNGEFGIDFDLPEGASLNASAEVGVRIDKILHTLPEIAYTVRHAGNQQAQSFKGSFYVRLTSRAEGRKISTTQVKDVVREKLVDFKKYNIKVADPDASGQNERQFNLNIVGNDLTQVEKYADQVFRRIRQNPNLKEVDTSYRPGKPEVQIKVHPDRAVETGVSLQALGNEVHNYIEGSKPATLLSNGRDYDVRVRLNLDQRDLMANYNKIGVPNINGQLIPLHLIADAVEARGPAEIRRQNRAKYIQLSADITPGGSGLGGAINEVTQLLKLPDMKPPPGVDFAFVGQAERFQELIVNIFVSLGLGVFFIYLVLASLYESFITPFTIMMVIPLAACGAFAGLFFARTSLDLFSMIGCVTLMGLATKNSILIVDFVRERQREGMDRYTALLAAGRARLRPILMTSFAMIAGMVPVAIGLNEASKQRTSLGIAIIGGTISSTLLALVLIPAVYWYVDRFEAWFRLKFNRYVRGVKTTPLAPTA